MNKLEHIAFIMDGNGRWAKKRNKPRIYGHNEGAKRIPEIVKVAKEFNIPHISFFAFSTENWNRSKEEVNFLLKLFTTSLTKTNLKKINKENVKVKWIGFYENLPNKLIDKINVFELGTQNNTSIQVNLFFNYSGIKDLNEALKKIKNENNVENIKNFLLTKNLPPIDLLIRTSGEQRISNFALYDLAYSEIIFEKTLWPDYSKKIFLDNINEYNTRDRRFGKIKNG